MSSLFYVCRSFLVITALFSANLASHAYALDPLPQYECAITAGSPQTPACTANFGGAISDDLGGIQNNAMPYKGVRSDPGLSTMAIDINNVCRFVDNSSTATSLFVPFHLPQDWAAFYTDHPSYINAVHCSRGFNPGNVAGPPATYSLGSPYADAACTPIAIASPNFYQRYVPGGANATFPVTPPAPAVQFTDCWSNTTTIEVNTVWQPLDSDNSNLNLPPDPIYNTSWTLPSVYGPDINLDATSVANPTNPIGTTLNLGIGDTLTLTWPASTAETCSASSNSQTPDPNWVGAVSPTGGSRNFIPTGSNDVIYYLTCVQNGYTSIASATVNIASTTIFYAAYNKGYHAPTFVAKSGALICGNPSEGPSAGCLVNNTQNQTQGSASMENAGYICAAKGYTYVTCVGGTINDHTESSPFQDYKSSLQTATGFIPGPDRWYTSQEGSNEYGHVSSVGCANSSAGSVSFTLTNGLNQDKNNLKKCGWN